MPETQAHQNKQNRTHLALSDIQQSQNSRHHADWIVTLAFYKALHAVDSYLAKLDIHPKGHRKRIEEVQKRLDSVYTPHRLILRLSSGQQSLIMWINCVCGFNIAFLVFDEEIL